MAADPRLLFENPALSTIAPLVLAAWDDAFLTPAELLEIRSALEALAPSRESSEVLRSWLDPKSPPSVQQLRELRAALSAPSRARVSASAELPASLRTMHTLLGLARPRAGGASASATARTAQPAAARLAPAEIRRLRAALDGAESAVRDEARGVLNEEGFRVPREDETAPYREQVLGFCRRLSRLSALSPEVVDDPRRSLTAFAATFETIAYFDLSVTVKFGVHFGLFANALQQLGSAEHRALLPAVRSAELLGCFAMTERAHGSNVRDLQTRAVYDADRHEFVIHTHGLSAGKEWIGGAAQHARLAVVFAQLHVAGEECGVHALLVPIRDINGTTLPGVRVEDCGHKMGLNGVDNGRLWFENVRVPHSALLDRFGRVTEGGRYESSIPSPSKRFFRMLGTLVGGRVNVAGAALSAAKLGLAIALTYSSRRHQFPDHTGAERPLLDYLTHRQRLLPALAHAYAFSFAQEALLLLMTSTVDDPDGRRRAESLAAGVKSIGTWRALDTLQKCRECCGGQGYLTVNRLDALRTDADVFTTFEGDNTVLCQQLVKELLRDAMHVAAGGAADNRAAAAGERANGASAGAASLLDANVQQRAFAFREETLRDTLVVRIERRLAEGADPQAAFEACQDHVLTLARAHIERFAFESFREARKAEPLISELCVLYALSCLTSDMGWFLEHGFFTPNDARHARDLQRSLLDEIAPRSLDYVAAFAIPQHCLGPLADATYLERSGLVPAASEARGPSAR